MVFSSSIVSEDALNQLQKSLNNLTEFFAENQLNLCAILPDGTAQPSDDTKKNE